MLRFIISYIWAVLTGKRYVSKLLMVNASVWWDKEGKSIASFEKITKHTAIGVSNNVSAKIYFPVNPHGEIVEGIPMYRAEVKLKTIMMANQLDKWVDKIDKHPFV